MEKSILNSIKNLDTNIVRFMCKDEPNKKLPRISSSQIKIINFMVAHRNEEIYQKDIEIFLGFRRSTISSILSTMEKNKIIEKTTGSKDKKQKKIILSKRSLKKIEKSLENMEKIEYLLHQGLSEEDIKHYFRIVEIMEKNLKNIE